MEPCLATVTANRPLAEGMQQLVLHCPAVFAEPVLPGMFAHIKVPGDTAHILRRPISIMDADAKAQTLTLGIQPKGEGTRAICAAAVGSQMDLLAPLGHGFSDHGAKTIWALGGGVGVAPMLYTCKCFAPTAKVTAVMGFRSVAHIFAAEEFRQYSDRFLLCTDDGSAGVHGTVLDAVAAEGELPELVVACGPAPMLRAVQLFCRERNIPAELSLEQRMGCGYGACLCCSCKTVDAAGAVQHSRVCADGPVFDAKEVLF